MIEIKKAEEGHLNLHTIITTDNVDEAVDAIIELYHSESEVVMGELLEGISLSNLSIKQVVDVYAKCMQWAERDVILHLNVEDGFIFAHGDGITDEYLDDICAFAADYRKKIPSLTNMFRVVQKAMTVEQIYEADFIAVMLKNGSNYIYKNKFSKDTGVVSKTVFDELFEKSRKAFVLNPENYEVDKMNRFKIYDSSDGELLKIIETNATKEELELIKKSVMEKEEGYYNTDSLTQALSAKGHIVNALESDTIYF